MWEGKKKKKTEWAKEIRQAQGAGGEGERLKSNWKIEMEFLKNWAKNSFYIFKWPYKWLCNILNFTSYPQSLNHLLLFKKKFADPYSKELWYIALIFLILLILGTYIKM